MIKMTAEGILNEVRRQHREMNNTRYKPDATLFISEDCWLTLLKELSHESRYDSKGGSGSTRCLLGYTTIVVKDLKQYVELKENEGYGGLSPDFIEWS